MSIKNISRPVHRFLADRVDQLRQALEQFGERVRAGIAAVIGGHIGDAVRDALHAVLHARTPAHQPYPDSQFDHPFDLPCRDGAQDERTCEEPLAFWDAPEPHPPPSAAPEVKPRSRWFTLLTGALRGWFLDRVARPSSGIALAVGIAGVGFLLTPLTASFLVAAGAAVCLCGWQYVQRRPACANMP